jgi:hypothetical protein
MILQHQSRHEATSPARNTQPGMINSRNPTNHETEQDAQKDQSAQERDQRFSASAALRSCPR